MFETYTAAKEQVLTQIGSLGFAEGTDWLTALLALAVVFVLLRIFRWLLLKLFRYLQRRKKQNFFGALADFVAGLDYFFDLVVALYVATLFVTLPEVAERTINTVFVIIMVIYMVVSLRRFIVDLFEVFYRLGHKGETEVDKTAVVFFRVLIESLLWMATVIVILQSWGFNVSVLLGGLGVASVIISLSFQNVLKDVFSFFAIYTDRTFRVGDFVKTTEIKGTVTEIGLRATKVKAVGGHEVTVSNRMLVDGVVENFERLEERQVVAEITVAVGTSERKLEKIGLVIADFFANDVELQKHVVLKRAYLMQITNNGFIYEVVYVVTVADYEIYTRMKERINLGIMKELERMHVELAGMGRMVVERPRL